MPVARWLVLAAAIIVGCGGQTTSTPTTNGPANVLSACIPGRVEGPQQSPRTTAVLVMIALANGNWSFH